MVYEFLFRLNTPCVDGKWVEDDYYEEKSLEEITSKGLKAGDLVGELPDPSSTYSSETAALAAAAKAGLNAQSKVDRGGASGVYRAGGPTTLFGGPGWGPYSDGPLNAVRKSLLNRDGLNEENWMFVAARRTVEAGEEWGKIRGEALKVCGGILGGGRNGKEAEERSTPPDNEFSRASKEATDGATDVPKKRKLPRAMGDLPLGVYEPHGGIVHCVFIPCPVVTTFILIHKADRTDTQPSRCRWEMVEDSGKKRVLGGTKTGNGAWALAWVDTVMELPAPDTGDKGCDVLMTSVESCV